MKNSHLNDLQVDESMGESKIGYFTWNLEKGRRVRKYQATEEEELNLKTRGVWFQVSAAYRGPHRHCKISVAQSITLVP